MQLQIGKIFKTLLLTWLFGISAVMATPQAFAEDNQQTSTSLPGQENAKRGNDVPSQSEMPKGYDILKVASTKIDLNVEDATVFDILKAIRKAAEESNISLAYTATSMPLEALQIHVTLKVKDLRLGDAFRLVAAIGQTGFYMLPDKFVISPYVLLTDDERKKIIKPEYDLPNLPKKTPVKDEGRGEQ